MIERLQYLLEKYHQGEITPVEQEELSLRLADPAYTSMVFADLEQTFYSKHIHEEWTAAVQTQLWRQVQPVVKAAPVSRISIWRWSAAAAVLLALAAYGWLQYHAVPPSSTAVVTPKVDVAPGKAGAILTLEDGRQVVLDSMGGGVVASQNGTQVVLKNGQLVYDAAVDNNGEVAYNTMSTPKGRQFSLVLPDGSRVWLNAASSLRYPVVFTGKNRMVEVKGEAYFEVAASSMPFRVKVNNETEVQVLGTHFNINSYEDETNISTTLLEGAVRVVNNEKSALLKPGQQALVPGKYQAGGKIGIVEKADLGKVMAWKNGVFNFQDAKLAQVMRQLERWYDIEVVYEGTVPELEFIGKMGRDLPLSAVLKGLEMSNVHFRIEAGRKVVVLP
jgi:ferric-dicitrate binding protein FerR (iron transport regulator)